MMVHLSHRQRRYVLRQHLLPAVLVNFLINFGLGWLFFHHHEQVYLWGALSFRELPSIISIDLIPTTFFLVFFTGLIVSRQVSGHLRQGRIEPVGNMAWLLRVTSLDRPLASLGAAVAVTLILVPATLLVFHWNAIALLPLWTFIWFKAVYAAALAALFTPVVVVRSLASGGG